MSGEVTAAPVAEGEDVEEWISRMVNLALLAAAHGLDPEGGVVLRRAYEPRKMVLRRPGRGSDRAAGREVNVAVGWELVAGHRKIRMCSPALAALDDPREAFQAAYAATLEARASVAPQADA